MARLETVLTPVKEELECERAEKAAIKEELDTLKHSRRGSDELQARCKQMESILKETMDAQNSLQRSRDKAKRHLQRSVDEVARLNKLHEKFDYALRKQKEEVAKLEVALKEANNDVGTSSISFLWMETDLPS